MDTRFTRRRFLKALAAGGAYLAVMDAGGCEPRGKPPKGVWAFRSRPDLRPAAVEVTSSAQAHDDTAPGYIFAALKEGAGEHGPMIIDDLGQLVWFGKYRSARDFKMQYYQGKPVLTWWEGKVVHGHGIGEYVIVDGSYREIAWVRAGNGYRGDLHELLITPQDTALITIYASTPADLSLVGGPKDGTVVDGITQELDIETGEVLFEWHSLDHVGFDEAYRKPSRHSKLPFDYFHINSIDVDYDTNLLVSAKGTFTVYKINRTTGEVMWRLGGKRSDFEMGPSTRTAYQHDARRQPDGTITIFDNGAYPKVHDQSRGIVIELDEGKMSAKLISEYTHPDRLLATSQGNMQVLPNGNVFIGWGSEPFISEFSHDGKLLFDAHFPRDCESYRAFRFQWEGHPTDAPAVIAESRREDKVTLYASWNGATEVTSWEVLAGPHPDQLESVESVPRNGFETAMLVQSTGPYLAVRAKDRSGEILGTSVPVEL